MAAQKRKAIWGTRKRKAQKKAATASTPARRLPLVRPLRRRRLTVPRPLNLHGVLDASANHGRPLGVP
eukprot:4581992-Lingulodinium_polyedra.AAC.1